MKKLALPCAYILLLLLSPTVCAFISVKSTIDDNIYVVYKFENLPKEIYEETKANPLFNSSTIPQIIVTNLEKQNLKLVRWGYVPQTNMYNDTTQSIHISFYLGGSDIISFTVNTTTMHRTYRVKTEWRKFELNLTSTFPIDFTQILAKPVAEWQKWNETTFFYQSTENGFLDMSFELTLPMTATQVLAKGDVISYQVPARFEDLIVNSPFLILFALIIVTLIVAVYRKVK